MGLVNRTGAIKIGSLLPSLQVLWKAPTRHPPPPCRSRFARGVVGRVPDGRSARTAGEGGRGDVAKHALRKRPTPERWWHPGGTRSRLWTRRFPLHAEGCGKPRRMQFVVSPTLQAHASISDVRKEHKNSPRRRPDRRAEPRKPGGGAS